MECPKMEFVEKYNEWFIFSQGYEGESKTFIATLNKDMNKRSKDRVELGGTGRFFYDINDLKARLNSGRDR
ncbi:MAG: hypothetical protein LBH81_02865 [Rickettsiales bacterium]|jgi:hypothetical protein|nr:hypothetical protein [Rickettsiales bacterium]